MSASAVQIEANRANAQKSTGPVTSEGKAASSRNATSHGLTSKEIFVRPGEETDFLSLEEELTALYDPQNEAEGVFFKILIHSAWNLRRCRQLEAVLQNEAIAKGILDPLLHPELAQTADRIARHLRAAERSHSKAVAELRKLQTERDYRHCYNEASGVDNTAISPAVDTKTISAEIDRHMKSQATTFGTQLRNRFAPGMPILSDNQDGTFTAHSADGTSILRFTDSKIVDVPGSPEVKVATAAA